MKISQAIRGFVYQVEKAGWVNEVDKTYLHNRLLAIMHLDILEPAQSEFDGELFDYLDAIIAYAIEQQLIEDVLYQREQLIAQIMDLITPLPSLINEKFWQLYADDPVKATDYFYELSQTNDYIKTRDIAKNIAYTYPGKYGDLRITINLSKPEKDPKEIALAKQMPASSYPKCALCMENEGYKGRPDSSARQNHRLIRFDLQGQTYGMQYSPYQYYNEHCIFFNQVHQPMVIDRQCFTNLLEIITQVPHYFAGSNADLPIVGGSILSHDHYQGGRFQFPMDLAKAYKNYSFKAYPQVSVELVEWPLSVIRLRSQSKSQIVDLAEKILQTWQGYSDSQLAIEAFTGKVPHNTITPIARRKENEFELDLVLRNNRQTDEHPDGIFHPHADIQHIKKENIGLIEVIGLAILPPRLLPEMEVLKSYLLDQSILETVAEGHRLWAEMIKTNRKVTQDNVQTVVEEEIGKAFERVLEDAGVFKLDEAGRKGILRFLETVQEVIQE